MQLAPFKQQNLKSEDLMPHLPAFNTVILLHYVYIENIIINMNLIGATYIRASKLSSHAS